MKSFVYLHSAYYLFAPSAYIAMKRTREEVVGVDMDKVLMLLSCRLETKFKRYSSTPNDVFECKTCNRQFPSFQALGGHRASHKKPRTLMGSDQDPKSENKMAQSKPKKHECSICGREFSSGQALGGHMRRHRTVNARFSATIPAGASVDGASKMKIPMLMRSNSKRLMCLDMDLNLTPLENELKLLFGNMAPKIDTLIS
ncbi:putative transcription factor C2H2 family [Rosa chinensis]|uniref:Putative transcription factor C2H2 family n=1 Tax=Rosa chinensis TaxID=74649 RepID=A0A2P6RA84_ROSCH|nr:putative transcription factor C2H2 family [Rosa chinensis]